MVIPSEYNGLPVTNIGWSAFEICTNLTSVSFGDNSQLASIDRSAFKNCTSITSVVIPDSVTIISVSAFEDCTSLKSIIIPGCVTFIGSFAFRYCNSLTSLIIPDSVTSIGTEAFLCTALTRVTFKDAIGCYVTQKSGETSGSNLTLTNPSTNATYLKSTYAYYYWYKN